MATRGEYNTRQRELLLQYLQANVQRRLTVDEVMQALKARGKKIGKTTVYRHLESLCEQGAVRKYAPGVGASACYQYLLNAGACKEHFHMVCASCGEMFHVDCDLMEDIVRHIRQSHGFMLDIEKTVLYGRCEACAKREKEREDGAVNAEKCDHGL